MTFVTASLLFRTFQFGLQAFEVSDGDGLSVHVDEVFRLQAAQIAGDQLSHGPDL